MNRQITNKLIPKPRLSVLLLAVAFLLQQCISLAPAFDEKITGSLLDSSTETMIIFSIASEGTDATTFPERSTRYDETIGAMEALKMQVDSRPAPAGKVIDKVSAELIRRGLPDIKEAPTSKALENIIRNLQVMKSTDKSQGLTRTEVSVFKTNVILFLDQALTYERYLER
jgi:hypothetical protein